MIKCCPAASFPKFVTRVVLPFMLVYPIDVSLKLFKPIYYHP